MMSLDPISAGLDLLTKVIGRIPDPTQAASALAELEKMKVSGEIQLALAQLNVNAEEAKNTNWFIAAWRPMLAWVCLLDVFSETAVYPMVAAYIPVHVPSAIGITMPILLTLIGARSLDKFNGVDTK